MPQPSASTVAGSRPALERASDIKREDGMLALSRLKSFSQVEFAALGRSDMAYVKPVEIDGTTNYAIHAADGRYLWQCDSREVACAALRQHDLEPMSVH